MNNSIVLPSIQLFWSSLHSSPVSVSSREVAKPKPNYIWKAMTTKGTPRKVANLLHHFGVALEEWEMTLQIVTSSNMEFIIGELTNKVWRVFRSALTLSCSSLILYCHIIKYSIYGWKINEFLRWSGSPKAKGVMRVSWSALVVNCSSTSQINHQS